MKKATMRRVAKWAGGITLGLLAFVGLSWWLSGASVGEAFAIGLLVGLTALGLYDYFEVADLRYRLYDLEEKLKNQ